MGRPGNVYYGEDAGQLLYADLAVDAALFLEEIVDEVQKLLAEFEELVGRIGHDKQLPEVFKVCLDWLELFVHLKVTSVYPS